MISPNSKLTVAVAFLFIGGVSSGKIPNMDGLQNDACRREQGQFFSKTTLSCEACLKYCQIGKGTSACPQQCDAFMDRMTQENREKSERDKEKPHEHREPQLGYLAVVLVLVVPGLIAAFVVKRRNSISENTRNNALLPTLPNGPPNQIAQHEELNQVASSCAPPANRLEHPTSQDTKRPERTFVQVSDSREEGDDTGPMMQRGVVREEPNDLVLSIGN